MARARPSHTSRSGRQGSNEPAGRLRSGTPRRGFRLAWSLFELLRGRQDGMQRRSLHTRHELHQTGVADIENQTVDDLVAEIAMRHLPAFEAQRSLHLVAFAKKPD